VISVTVSSLGVGMGLSPSVGRSVSGSLSGVPSGSPSFGLVPSCGSGSVIADGNASMI